MDSSFVDDGYNASSSDSSQGPFTGASSPPDSAKDSAMTTPPEALTLTGHYESIAIKLVSRAVPTIQTGTGMHHLDMGLYGV